MPVRLSPTNYEELYMRLFVGDLGECPGELRLQTINDLITATAGQTVFTLTNTPIGEFPPVIKVDDVIMYPDTDYTISSNLVTLTHALAVGHKFKATYWIPML